MPFTIQPLPRPCYCLRHVSHIQEPQSIIDKIVLCNNKKKNQEFGPTTQIGSDVRILLMTSLLYDIALLGDITPDDIEMDDLTTIEEMFWDPLARSMSTRDYASYSLELINWKADAVRLRLVIELQNWLLAFPGKVQALYVLGAMYRIRGYDAQGLIPCTNPHPLPTGPNGADNEVPEFDDGVITPASETFVCQGLIRLDILDNSAHNMVIDLTHLNYACRSNVHVARSSLFLKELFSYSTMPVGVNNKLLEGGCIRGFFGGCSWYEHLRLMDEHKRGTAEKASEKYEKGATKVTDILLCGSIDLRQIDFHFKDTIFRNNRDHSGSSVNWGSKGKSKKGCKKEIKRPENTNRKNGRWELVGLWKGQECDNRRTFGDVITQAVEMPMVFVSQHL
ncbi:hypothetical protein CPB83DRAFT_841166 [Crepidotus variabilis]|uniref:Uncharacterized protein n=1 Tax=Crepidotus variabilis TaxID=179855 RepID=A0A9P6E302_9AGAR|nr:hypothetical protein CPB83DRAFT_841166 [Crepidotus variabilis]